MTATIVTAIGREELAPMSDDLIVTLALRDGDAGLVNGNRKVAAGQLWERLAEVAMGTVDLGNVTDAQADRMHAVVYSARRAARAFSRGSRAVDVAPNPGAVRFALKANLRIGVESGVRRGAPKMTDADGAPILVDSTVRIGDGKAEWVVRWPRPDLGEVGLVRAAAGPSMNRYVSPEWLHRVTK